MAILKWGNTVDKDTVISYLGCFRTHIYASDFNIAQNTVRYQYIQGLHNEIDIPADFFHCIFCVLQINVDFKDTYVIISLS